jgi:DNA-binding transcriptional LysR family regulator
MSIQLREMRQVAAIAKEGSFAKAARVLHISQPALSRSIREVERKTGFRLFDREREGTFLTDAGLPSCIKRRTSWPWPTTWSSS